MLLTVAISQHLRPATHRTYDGRCCNTESKNSIYKHENNLKSIFRSSIHSLALSLLVFRVFTDNSDPTFSFNDFAFFANRFY